MSIFSLNLFSVLCDPWVHVQVMAALFGPLGVREPQVIFESDGTLALKMYKQFQMEAAVVMAHPIMQAKKSGSSTSVSAQARATLAEEKAAQRSALAAQSKAGGGKLTAAGWLHLHTSP